MEYSKIYSRFMSRAKPNDLIQLSESNFYSVMNEYLHNAVSDPMIRKLFASLLLDDMVQEISFELNDSIDKESDERFVIDILSQSLVIQWMKNNLDTSLAISTMIGGKEEKVLKNDLKTNISRLDSLECKLQKAIRNHGYYNNSRMTGE